MTCTPWVRAATELCWYDAANTGDRNVTRIYCGNLPFSSTEEDVRALFEEFGTVNQVDLISDRETGRPRGFGFVDMDDEAAAAAIQALDGTEFGGRNLRVNEARPRNDSGGGNSNRNRGYNNRW